MYQRLWICIPLVLASLGCKPGLIPIQTAPVQGTATFEGKPLENYRVYFYVDTAEAMEPATGVVGPDGTFSMSVRTPGDGAIVGLNKVWLTYDPVMPELPPGQETAWSPPPAKVKLPAKYMTAETSQLTVEVPRSGLKDYKIDLK